MLRFLEPLSYLGLALALAGATWWLLSTVERAHEADRLEAQLVSVQAAREAEAAFARAVTGLTAAVDGRMASFINTANARTQVTREKIIREVPAGNPCFSLGTVRLLNGAARSAPTVPAAAGNP